MTTCARCGRKAQVFAVVIDGQRRGFNLCVRCFEAVKGRAADWPLLDPEGATVTDERAEQDRADREGWPKS